MIREMKEEDLQQCGVIYAKAFPIEYWGIDWNPDNAKEYLLDYYEQKRLILSLGCSGHLRTIGTNKSIFSFLCLGLFIISCITL